ncbi:MAG TPA: cytochrome P450 [Acetobacteraceae bacterium]|nr:cytochrome P450 [Acetobacteraceae bacterium]
MDRNLGTRDATLSAGSGDAPDDGVITLSIAELDADPHGVYRRYRPLTPFIAHESGSYIVLRADDVERFARDPRLRQSETEYPEIHGITSGLLFDLFKYGMLMSNGAVHRRRRAPFTRTFAARLIMEMRPRIRKTAETLVEEWYEDGEVDLVQRYAALIPARTISDLLGLPKDDIPEFTSLVYQVTRILSFLFRPDELPELEDAARKLFGYVENTLNERRKRPREDFLSAFVASADAAEDLSPFEIITQIVTLIIGGTDTTRVAAAVQVALLLQDRAQWNEVCRDPALIPGAVTEALRYEPSVASLARIPLEDIEIDGRVLPAGQFLILSTMSAMRDEQLYARPDIFDIHRTDHPRLPLVFGGGPHRCLGEALARVELEEGLSVLASHVPQLELAGGSARVQGHSGIRRIGEMRVAWQR